MVFRRLVQWMLGTSTNQALKQPNQQNEKLLDKEEEEDDDYDGEEEEEFAEVQNPAKEALIPVKKATNSSDELITVKETSERLAGELAEKPQKSEEERSADLVTIKKTEDVILKANLPNGIDTKTSDRSSQDLISIRETDQVLSKSLAITQKPPEESITRRETDELHKILAPQIQKSTGSPKRSAEEIEEDRAKEADKEKDRDVMNVDDDVLSKYFVCVGSAENSAETSSPTNSDSTEARRDVTDNMIKVAWKPDSAYKLSTRKISLPEMFPPYVSLQFSRTAIVYGSFPYMQQVHKRVIRTRHDGWRRYGALLKIHELGGWSFDSASAPTTRHGHHSHVQSKSYYRVDSGSKPAAAPTLPPIMHESELLKRPLMFFGSSRKRGDRRSCRKRNVLEDFDRDDKAEPERSPRRDP